MPHPRAATRTSRARTAATLLVLEPRLLALRAPLPVLGLLLLAALESLEPLLPVLEPPKPPQRSTLRHGAASLRPELWLRALTMRQRAIFL